MELVAGEDLSTRLARGRMPVEDALAAAAQVCEALEAAHDAGVVHRDLKPANVMLTPAAKVKVFDFGLAKLIADPGPGSDTGVSTSPTMTSGGTQAGIILGTAAYMSPEQARGTPVDRRADLWAVGCLLFEMLSGRRVFGGETVTDTLAAVVRAEPDWTVLPPGTSAAVRRCCDACSRKTRRGASGTPVTSAWRSTRRWPERRRPTRRTPSLSIPRRRCWAGGPESSGS